MVFITKSSAVRLDEKPTSILLALTEREKGTTKAINKDGFKNARLKIETPTTPEELTRRKFNLLSPPRKRRRIGTID